MGKVNLVVNNMIFEINYTGHKLLGSMIYEAVYGDFWGSEFFKKSSLVPMSVHIGVGETKFIWKWLFSVWVNLDKVIILSSLGLCAYIVFTGTLEIATIFTTYHLILCFLDFKICLELYICLKIIRKCNYDGNIFLANGILVKWNEKGMWHHII